MQREVDTGTIVSGASALAVWRTPPVVRALLLASSPNEGIPLSASELAELQQSAHRELALWRHGSVLGKLGRPQIAESTLDVLGSLVRLSPSLTPPVEVLVPTRAARRRSDLVTPHVLDPELTQRYCQRMSRTLSIASPELTLLTLAPRLSLERLVMVATEFCGTFSVFACHSPYVTLWRVWRETERFRA